MLVLPLIAPLIAWVLVLTVLTLWLKVMRDPTYTEVLEAEPRMIESGRERRQRRASRALESGGIEGNTKLDLKIERELDRLKRKVAEQTPKARPRDPK